MTPVEFRGDLWHQKTRLPVVSRGVVCVILRFAVLVELRLVTDTDRHRQTDTNPWLVPRMYSIKRTSTNYTGISDIRGHFRKCKHKQCQQQVALTHCDWSV